MITKNKDKAAAITAILSKHIAEILSKHIAASVSRRRAVECMDIKVGRAAAICSLVMKNTTERLALK